MHCYLIQIIGGTVHNFHPTDYLLFFVGPKLFLSFSHINLTQIIKITPYSRGAGKRNDNRQKGARSGKIKKECEFGNLFFKRICYKVMDVFLLY